MAPRRKKSTPALEDFPKSLRMAIAKVMTTFNLDYVEALELAAQLLDINSRIFKTKVEQEAERRYRSRFMTSLNKARTTIEEGIEQRVNVAYQNGYIQGYDKAKEDYGVWYHCKVCQKPMYISPNSEVHRIVNEVLHQRGWGHKSCHEQRR